MVSPSKTTAFWRKEALCRLLQPLQCLTLVTEDSFTLRHNEDPEPSVSPHINDRFTGFFREAPSRPLPGFVSSDDFERSLMKSIF